MINSKPHNTNISTNLEEVNNVGCFLVSEKKNLVVSVSHQQNLYQCEKITKVQNSIILVNVTQTTSKPNS